MNKETWLENIKNRTDKGTAYIVGGGNYGNILREWLVNNGVRVKGFVDCKENSGFYPYSFKFENNAVFIISSVVHKQSMINELLRNGISETSIINGLSQEILYQIIDNEKYGTYLSDLKKLRGSAKRKRCFIVGNGPSLNYHDLDQITNEDTFGCNGIYKVFESTKWRPKYYCGIDPTFCRVELQNASRAAFFSKNCEFFFTSITNNGFQYRDLFENYRFVKTINWYKNGLRVPFFANDIEKGVCVSGTVSYLMMQLAFYFGYKEIYLLGMDFSFSVERHNDGRITINDTKNHFGVIDSSDIQEENRKVTGFSYVADVDVQTREYIKAREYAKENELKIYNATRGGKLEVFERVDFDGLFM